MSYTRVADRLLGRPGPIGALGGAGRTVLGGVDNYFIIYVEPFLKMSYTFLVDENLIGDGYVKSSEQV